jgi:hypothetical protein
MDDFQRRCGPPLLQGAVRLLQLCEINKFLIGNTQVW